MSTVMKQLKGGGSNTLSNLRPGKPQFLENEALLKLYNKFKSYCESDGLEISVTYKTELRIRYTATTLTKMVKNIIDKISHAYDMCIDIMMIGEYSKTGHYHMHGVVKGVEGRILNDLVRKLTRECGRTELKAIQNTNNYALYPFKVDFNSQIGYKTEDGDVKLRKIPTSEIIDI